MSTINYIRENKAFLRYAMDNGLSSAERELWQVLFNLFNDRANGNQWPDGFLRLPNKLVLAWVSFGEDTLGKARNRLAQRGLIEFVRGNRREDLPMYRMIWLTAPRQAMPADDDPTFYPIFSGKTSGKNEDYTYSDINETETETETWDSVPQEVCVETEEEEEQQDARAREAATAAVKNGFREYFGRQPHRAEVSKITWSAGLLEFNPEMIMLALRIAAENGAKAPAAYAVQMFHDFDTWSVYTPEDYSRHLYHVRNSDMTITEQLKERDERLEKHREAMRHGPDSGLGFPGGGAETPEARMGPHPGGAAAAGRRGPGDGIAGPGPDREPRDAGARQDGQGGAAQGGDRDPGGGLGGSFPRGG